MKPFLHRHGPWILVALAAIAVYLNSLANGFAYDDMTIIERNARVHQLTDQARIWLKPYWPSYGPELGLYRPFAIFMYAVEWALGGGKPFLFHAFNVTLHALASVLAFFLTRCLVGGGPAPLIGALVFALHPVRTEAVANVVGQAELLAGAATLGACLIHATRPSGADTGWTRRLATVILFAIAMLTKESAIVLPGLLVALDVAQRRVHITAASVLTYLRSTAMLLFLLTSAAIAYLALRVDVLGSLGGVDAAPSLPFLRNEARVPTAFRAWPEYVRLLFFPSDLAADYSPAVILPVEGLSPMALLGATILFLTVVLALLTPIAPAAGLPAAWFFITVLPVSNLLMPIGVVVAERLLYTPGFALTLIVAAAWQKGQARWSPGRMPMRLAYAATTVVLGLFAYRTVVRNPDWKSMDAVANAVLRDHPESYRAQWIMSGRLFGLGNSDLGLQTLEMAYRIWPNDGQVLAQLANQYIATGAHHEALELLERSRQYVDWAHNVEQLLAAGAIGTGEYQRALDAIIRADRLGSPRHLTFPVYAQAYEGLGRIPDAIGAWKASVRQAGADHWIHWSRLARALAVHGDSLAALDAADTAMARLSSADSLGAKLVPQVRDAIGRGCYRPAPRTNRDFACTDPLADWEIVLPGLLRFAKDSQNAMHGATRSERHAANDKP